MVVFNPEIPSPLPPNYASLSRAYEGASATAALVRGAGDVIENATKGADTVVKAVIDKGIEGEVDKTRSQFTSSLEDAAGVPAVMRSTPQNILPETDTAQPPAEVGAGLDKTAGTVAAGAKIRPLLNTYYSAQLDKIAKDYRSRFPGYVDYIDKKFESYTGQNPANKIISDLIGVIQSGSDSQKSNLEKARSLLESHAGETNEINGEKVTASQMMQIINSGQVSDPLSFVMRWSEKNDALKVQQKDIQSNATTLDASNKINVDRAAKAMVDLSVLQSQRVWNNVLGKVPGLSTAELNAAIDRAQRGEDIGLNEKQFIILADAMDAEIRQAKTDLRTRSQIKDKDGNSLFGALGGDVEKHIDSGLKTMADLRDAIRSKDGGLIGRTARFATGILNQNRYDLLSDPKMASKFLPLDAANHFGGAQVAAVLAAESLRNGMAQDMFNYFDQQRGRMLSPPENYTLKQVIEDAENKKVGVPLPPTDPQHRPNAKQEREFYDKMLRFPGKVLSDPNIAVPAKVQIARQSFGPDNLGLIQKFESGPDRTKAWSTLTDKDSVVTPLKKLSAADPYVWKDAKSWADLEFRRYLFSDEVNNLSKFVDSPTVGIGFRPGDANSPPAFYAYERIPSGGGEDRYNLSAERTRARVQNTYFNNVQSSLNRLNAGIAGMHNFIAADGGDSNAYVLKTMIDAGFDPKKSVGIPGDMMKAIVTPEPVVDSFKTKDKKKDQSKP